MKFGLTHENWEIVKKTVIEPLKKNGSRLYIYGSRARGDHKPFSDLDITYTFTNSEIEKKISSIRAQLEESHLPIKVDLVSWEDLPKTFLPQIESEKIEVT